MNRKYVSFEREDKYFGVFLCLCAEFNKLPCTHETPYYLNTVHRPTIRHIMCYVEQHFWHKLSTTTVSSNLIYPHPSHRSLVYSIGHNIQPMSTHFKHTSSNNTLNLNDSNMWSKKTALLHNTQPKWTRTFTIKFENVRCYFFVTFFDFFFKMASKFVFKSMTSFNGILCRFNSVNFSILEGWMNQNNFLLSILW